MHNLALLDCTTVQNLALCSLHYSTSLPTCKVQSARSCIFAHVQVLSSYQDPVSSSMCKMLHICTRASTKILSRPNFKNLFLHLLLPARCKVQDLAYLHRCKFYVLIKTQFLHHPHLQGANCKILHICTSASIKFLSRPNFFINPYMQGAKCKILHIYTCASTKILSRPNFKILFLHHLLPSRCKVQDLAHLHTCKY